jgi:chromosome segregation ATPase
MKVLPVTLVFIPYSVQVTQKNCSLHFNITFQEINVHFVYIWFQPTRAMSKMTREEKLFKNEISVLNHYRGVVAQPNSPNETKEALEQLTNKYKALLEQTRFLTWISGRLERKLQRTNAELFQKNNRLQSTLNELTKAEAGRSAYAIIYFIAIVLFVLEEFFVEPLIGIVGNGLGYNIIIKLAIVLLLKVSEGVIEKRITKKTTVKEALKHAS